MDIGLRNEIVASVRRQLAMPSADEGSCGICVSDPEPFEHSGASGNELLRVGVVWESACGAGEMDVIIKRWEPTAWVTMFMGRSLPVELLLWENDLVSGINSVPGFSAPIIGATRLGDDAWVVELDVGEYLTAWKSLTSESTDLQGEFLLLDRLARFHAAWEKDARQQKLKANSGGLVSTERRLQWFDELQQEWLLGRPPDPDESDAMRAAKEFAGRRRHLPTRFLQWLPERDRRLWEKHMVDRTALVDASKGVPFTLLHGDLVSRNIAVRHEPEADEIILIDWELAGIGTPAFDVVHYLGHPIRGVSDHFELLDYYFERYQEHSGRALSSHTWTHSCDLALAQYGVTFFPFWGGARLGQDNMQYEPVVEHMAERVKQAIFELGC